MPRLHRIIKESIQTASRSQMVEITDRVQKLLRQKQMMSGQVIIYIPHTTAAATIQENADPDVQHDLLAKLEKLVPKEESYYRHAEGNSDSHLKAAMLGNSVTVLVEGGKLQLGQWQGVYFVEFDGPREREVWIRLEDWSKDSPND